MIRRELTASAVTVWPSASFDNLSLGVEEGGDTNNQESNNSVVLVKSGADIFGDTLENVGNSCKPARRPGC